jgi:hypothetical protein
MASWTQLGLDINGEAANDQSGRSVSLSADGLTVAIGAALNVGNGNNSGHVRIYKWNGTSWNQLGLDIDGEATNDNSGFSVSLSTDGLTVAIGAYGNDGNGNNSGHVRIYKWNGTSWNQLGLDIDGEAQWDQSGWSVSLSADGTTVAIGAALNVGNGRSNSGHVRIYNWNGTSWNQVGLDIDGEAANDQSGWSVSLSADGTTIAIGAYGNDEYRTNSGHVRIYKWNGTSWNQLGSDINGERQNDNSGWSVSLSADGLTVAIGAYGNDGNVNNSGHVRIYKWNQNLLSWNQLGLDIDGEATNDYSGWSVSLSADGTTLAIGAYGNDGNVNDSGYDSGHVRIYKWNGTSWNQVGSDIDGEAQWDESGRSVSLSADGTTVAIGAYGNDGNGNNSGHVRIYKWVIPNFPICFPAGTPVQTDQGSIAIEKINLKTNTIRGKNIVAVTKTITIEDKIVCIEKDALGTNIPSQKTFISRNHELFYNKQMIKAKNLIGVVDGVYNKKYNGEILYNVLLDKHDKMIVNNLIVETLDPENIVAKLYNGGYSVEEKNNIIVNLNNGAKEYKKQFGKMR